MPDEDPAIPCGLVAKSVFNDTYELWREGDKSRGEADVNITIETNNIAWTSDVTYKFRNIENKGSERVNHKDIQWIDMKDRKLLVNFHNFCFSSLHRLDADCRSAQLPKALGRD